MFSEILTYVLAVTLPYLVVKGCRMSKILDAIGPIIILYALGLVCGLLGLRSNAQTILSGLTVPVAIPLILFGNSLSISRKTTRDPILAFFSCLAAAVISVVVSFMIFRPDTTVAGMVTGCVTGGTMNMASVKLALGADDSVFVLLNTYDMAVSFVYMTVLLLFGIRLSRKILPRKTSCSDAITASSSAESDALKKASVKDYAFVIGCSILCCLVGLGVSQLFPESVFMMVFIIAITLLGTGLSFVRKIRTTPGSYDAGMYFVYAFSFVVASMADFTSMSLGENTKVLCFFACVVFGSLTLHMIFSYILKIDADTAVIASNAFINAPPSVPVIASAQKNRSALSAGLTIGIVGYALGTYIGILMAKCLSLL